MRGCTSCAATGTTRVGWYRTRTQERRNAVEIPVPHAVVVESVPSRMPPSEQTSSGSCNASAPALIADSRVRSSSSSNSHLRRSSATIAINGRALVRGLTRWRLPGRHGDGAAHRRASECFRGKPLARSRRSSQLLLGGSKSQLPARGRSLSRRRTRPSDRDVADALVRRASDGTIAISGCNRWYGIAHTNYL